VFLGSSVSFFISQFLGCVVAVQWPRYVRLRQPIWACLVLLVLFFLTASELAVTSPSAAHLGVPRSSGSVNRAATKLGVPLLDSLVCLGAL